MLYYIIKTCIVIFLFARLFSAFPTFLPFHTLYLLYSLVHSNYANGTPFPRPGHPPLVNGRRMCPAISCHVGYIIHMAVVHVIYKYITTTVITKWFMTLGLIPLSSTRKSLSSSSEVESGLLFGLSVTSETRAF